MKRSTIAVIPPGAHVITAWFDICHDGELEVRNTDSFVEVYENDYGNFTDERKDVYIRRGLFPAGWVVVVAREPEDEMAEVDNCESDMYDKAFDRVKAKLERVILQKQQNIKDYRESEMAAHVVTGVSIGDLGGGDDSLIIGDEAIDLTEQEAELLKSVLKAYRDGWLIDSYRRGATC